MNESNTIQEGGRPRPLQVESRDDLATDYFTARDIARATGWNKKFVTRTAMREGWPTRTNGNRFEYCPPPHIAEVMIATPAAISHLPSTISVRFADLNHCDAQRENVLRRESAVQLLNNNLHLGKEVALQLVCNQLKTEFPFFRISVSSLRRWADDYARAGLDGLVEQKRGRVGRKAYAGDLEPAQLMKLAAAATEYGIKGRLNTARAYRDLVANPTVSSRVRTWLHGDHASKSYVPPSVRAAVERSVAPLTRKLVQIGPKAMKLDGPYTECSYDNVPPGFAFTADDMTANVYVWCEWPNEQGFLLIRPQVLATMDIGSMAWLNLRAIIRPKGQYNRDDVWGLIGDTLDSHGLFNTAVLEGGTWQSEVVIGHKTGLSDDTRFGGLRALGVKVIHTRTPRGKIIETAFNSLQHAMDNCRGFCGRMEMKDCPEAVKQQKYDVEKGHAHPRQHFMHIREFSDHLEAVMKSLNHERNDGKICQGRAPVDVWAECKPQLAAMPESSKWMYRSAHNVREVTRNGVRISVGTGKFQQHYTYQHPALEVHRGRRVVVWWNDYDPDTDAVVYTLRNGKPDQFLCAASRVQEIPRFGASADQLGAEAARKKLAANLAVTQSRNLAPYLNRNLNPTLNPSAPGQGDAIAEKIQQARAQAATKAQQTKNVARFQGDAAELLGEATDREPSRLAAPQDFDTAESRDRQTSSTENRTEQAVSAPALNTRETLSETNLSDADALL